MKRPRGTGKAQVKTLIDSYRREFSTRFRDMRREVETAIVDEGRFGVVRSFRETGDGTPMTDGGTRANAGGFTFDTRADREAAFNTWLIDMIDDGLIEPMDNAAVRSGQHYTADYLRTAYDRGLKYADGSAKSRGVNLPIPQSVAEADRIPRHKSTLELLYSRNYRQLDGVGSHTEQKLSRIMTESFIAGDNPRSTARKLKNELTTIRKNRAEVLARTEFMNAHVQATAESYSAHGIQKADVLTAGNGVCAHCESLAAGNPHDIDDLRTTLPIHPNCRCSIAPVI